MTDRRGRTMNQRRMRQSRGPVESVKMDLIETPLNQMVKRVQRDNNKDVIPNSFRNLEIPNGNWSIAFV